MSSYNQYYQSPELGKDTKLGVVKTFNVSRSACGLSILFERLAQKWRKLDAQDELETVIERLIFLEVSNQER
jgi:hypothetical protein